MYLSINLSMYVSGLQVIEVVIKVESGFPRAIVKHLSKVRTVQ